MKRLICTLFLIVLFGFVAMNAEPEGAKYIKSSAKPSKLKVAEGEEFSIKLTITFSGEWYTYTLKKQENKEGLGPQRTEIKIGSANFLKMNGKIKSAKPHVKDDPAYEMKVEYFKPTAEFEIPVVAKKAIDFSKDKISIIARMQICNKTTCLPSDDYKIFVSKETYEAVADNSNQEKTEEVQTASTESASTTATIKQAEPDNKVQSAEPAKDDKTQKTSFLSMLLLAMAAGAAALLTPCVFPMVPITVSFFTKRFEQQKGSGNGLRDATVYALGIIVSFTLLGFIFSLLFGAAGVQNLTSNPWVAMFIAFIFLFFGLSLFGAYEIQLPTSLINKLNTKSQSSTGIASVILMAITFSLASFSCTGPLVGAALVGAANGEWFYPIVSMVGFSFVLAFPFFFLALFPTAMNKMPRAGSWMNNIKGVLGFIVLGASFKFINAGLEEWHVGMSRELFLGIWIACTFLITLYILGIFKMMHDSPVDRVGTPRLLFAVLFAAITFYLIGGLLGKPMGPLEAYLPTPEETEVVAASVPGTPQTAQVSSQVWLEDYKQAVEQAKKENKAIFIDFTGKHCPNCRLMERNVFSKPEIKSALSKMILVKLVTDVQEEPYQSNKQLQISKFNSVELPMYVILSPDEKLIDKRPFTSDVQQFKAFLDKGANLK